MSIAKFTIIGLIVIAALLSAGCATPTPTQHPASRLTAFEAELAHHGDLHETYEIGVDVNNVNNHDKIVSIITDAYKDFEDRRNVVIYEVLMYDNNTRWVIYTNYESLYPFGAPVTHNVEIGYNLTTEKVTHIIVDGELKC